MRQQLNCSSVSYQPPDEQEKERLSELRSAAAEAVYNSVTHTTDSRRMFEAVQTLNCNSSKTSSIGLHNEQGCLIAIDAGKAAVVAEYFEQQLTRDEVPLELASPFTCDEIGAAARSLKNGRANGPDGIPNELLKYSSNSVH